MERLDLRTINLQNLTLIHTLAVEETQGLIKTNQLRGYRVESPRLLHIAGDVCSAIDIVVSGCLAVEKINEEGEIFSVAVFGPQSIMGGNLIFSRLAQYPYSVTCLEEAVILRIDAEALFNVCTRNPAFLKQFLQLISDNTLVLNERLSHVSQKSLRKRLTKYLLAEAVKQRSKNMVLPVTKVRLAQMLGVSRTSVSRELTRMQEEGLLTYKRNRVELSDFL